MRIGLVGRAAAPHPPHLRPKAELEEKIIALNRGAIVNFQSKVRQPTCGPVVENGVVVRGLLRAISFAASIRQEDLHRLRDGGVA